MPRLLSVNVGLPRDIAWRGKTVRTAIWKTKLQKGTGQITDPLRLAVTKRDLARLLTVRRERASAEAAAKRS